MAREAGPYRAGLFDRAPWMSVAACRGMDTEQFYPPRGGDVAGPRAVCADCPVRQECRDYAIAHGDPFGIWGGTTGKQRRAVRRQQLQEQRQERAS